MHHYPRINELAEKGFEGYKQYLVSAFNNIFCNPKYLEEMGHVLLLLKQGENILELQDIESFCSLFQPFHVRMFEPFDVQKFLTEYIFPAALLEFLETCTFLEVHTDEFARYETMDQVNNKEGIIVHLEKLLGSMPSLEEFISWINAIRKK